MDSSSYRSTEIVYQYVYIVYACSPFRDLNMRRELELLQQHAEDTQLVPITAPHAPVDVRELDALLREGWSIATVVHHVNNILLQHLPLVWIAGRGSSYFAREIIRYSFDYHITIQSHAARSSVVRRYYEQQKHNRDRALKRLQIERLYANA